MLPHRRSISWCVNCLAISCERQHELHTLLVYMLEALKYSSIHDLDKQFLLDRRLGRQGTIGSLLRRAASAPSPPMRVIVCCSLVVSLAWCANTAPKGTHSPTENDEQGIDGYLAWLMGPFDDHSQDDLYVRTDLYNEESLYRELELSRDESMQYASLSPDEFESDDLDEELDAAYTTSIRDVLIAPRATVSQAGATTHWNEKPAFKMQPDASPQHDLTRQAIEAKFGALQNAIRTFVDNSSSLSDKFATGSSWWPRMDADKDYQKFMEKGLLENFVQEIQGIMRLTTQLPNYYYMPDGPPIDRRAVKSEKVTIGTFNCSFLNIQFSLNYTQDATGAKHFYHALMVAQKLDALNADVIVLQEVQNYGIAELVRLMMENGRDYRVYCTAKFDMERNFRTVLLTRIDPVEPLGWIRDPTADDIRHFVARLHVWLATDGSETIPLDIMGVHLPCYTSKAKNEEKSSTLQQAIIRRHYDLKDLNDKTPLVVAGDINSRLVDSKNEAKTNLIPERRTGLYVLQEGTKLVSCMTDNNPSTTRKYKDAIDHVLVPAELLYPDYNIYTQLETQVIYDDDKYYGFRWHSDHYPVRITLSLYPEEPIESAKWVPVTEEEKNWRVKYSHSPLKRSILSRDISSNESLMHSWSFETRTSASQSRELSVRPSSRMSVSPTFTSGNTTPGPSWSGQSQLRSSSVDAMLQHTYGKLGATQSPRSVYPTMFADSQPSVQSNYLNKENERRAFNKHLSGASPRKSTLISSPPSTASPVQAKQLSNIGSATSTDTFSDNATQIPEWLSKLQESSASEGESADDS